MLIKTIIARQMQMVSRSIESQAHCSYVSRKTVGVSVQCLNPEASAVDVLRSSGCV